MTLDEYVAWAAGVGASVRGNEADEQAPQEDALGFASEVGEVVGVLKTWLRDGQLRRDRLADELGDVAFHWARLSVLTGVAPSTLLARSRAHVEWRRAGRPAGTPRPAPGAITLEEFVAWAAGAEPAPAARPDDRALGDVGLALAGDAGEVVECLRRLAGGDDRERERLAGELGDVWRYWVRLAVASGVAPGEILARSRAKIEARLAERATSVREPPRPRLPSVTSRDGTPIAYERSGTGPPLVLVHGGISDHTYWRSVLPALSARFTTYAMDRRGRGQSGDADRYAIDREAEDVAALVDSIGEPVTLLGHSYGAVCALEAALRTDRIRTLVLYEPPLDRNGFTVPPGFGGRLAEALAAGDRDRAVETMMLEVVGLSPAELSALRASPSWAALVATVHTLPREVRAAERYRFAPKRFGRLALPAVLLAGEQSPEQLRVEGIRLARQALVNSRVIHMPGVGHEAVETGPEVFAATVLGCLAENTGTPTPTRRSPPAGRPRRSSSARRRSR
jgi:pimeloyl-ACP methyl ester carboxylesterase/NTP pyrophosphatase (non-canonical NTP hydrolase)